MSHVTQRLSPADWGQLLSGLVVLLATVISTGLIVGVRGLGGLESLELAAYDRLMQLRPEPVPDPRILVVGITEADIQAQKTWPLPDQVYAELLAKLLVAQPRAIGLDIYRDLPLPPGHTQLNQIFQDSDRIFAVTKIGDETHPTINAPSGLSPQQVGFNDVIVDAGGIVRRNILFLGGESGTLFSFSLRLALRYLQDEQIRPQANPRNSQEMQLGQTIFVALQPNSSAYVQADTQGYQVMLNYRGNNAAITWVSLGDVLAGRFDPSLIRNRVVLIGTLAESGKDFFYTPFSSALQDEQRMPGVVIHAQMVSQFLDAGAGKKATFWYWSWPVELVWIALWAGLGSLLAWGFRQPWLIGFGAVLSLGSLFGIAYGLFLHLGWIPLVPPALAFIISGASVITYTAQQAQQQRQMVMRLLGQSTSPEIAATLWQRRNELLQDGRLPGQKLVATLLFTDLKGFSTISETMAPEDLLPWLNDYLEKVADIVQAHQGVINKFTGDGIMAVFGVPIPRTTEAEIAQDAKNAVDCALALGESLGELNQAWSRQGLPQVGMRIGIFTGPIVAGSLGSKTRLEYGVIGDSVNTASRLESVDKHRHPTPCRILIAAETLAYVPDRYQVEAWGALELKGKEHKIQVYLVQGHRHPQSRPGLVSTPNAQGHIN
ncbi:CHASE2 domain-containing protein [Synechococcus sp. PCC 6312]|uniref:CHASE2 domain-containing protein n=1 Tax=Synechococcus sp. (strain ATCC 27167 / PCC 6312) TaxID=195253 RepID=UPI0020A1D369|nr:adenylate/guanylate cyclase domain-containing protein [Synechococcus sp. PCC 6312]